MTLPAKVCCRVVSVLTIYTVELCLLQQKSDIRGLPVTAEVCLLQQKSDSRGLPVTAELCLLQQKSDSRGLPVTAEVCCRAVHVLTIYCRTVPVTAKV